MNHLKAFFLLSAILLIQLCALWTHPAVANAQDLALSANNSLIQNNDDDPPTCGDSDNDGECDPQTNND